MGTSKQASIMPKKITIILFISDSDVCTSLGNDNHINDVELKEADQLKSLTLDPPAKFGIDSRIWL